MEAMKSQLQTDAIVCSKSLARRRFRFRHAKVRSTTQRRGRIMKHLVRSDRLMISIVQSPILVSAALSFPLHTLISEHMMQPRTAIADVFYHQWRVVSFLDAGAVNNGINQRAIHAGDDMALAAFHFLARIISPYPATFRCFDRLAIDHASTG